MRTLTKTMVFVLLLALSVGAFANDFNKAQYFKKAVPGQKKSDPVDGTFRVDPTTRELQFVNRSGAVEFSVKHDKIKNLLYERTAKPRYAAGLLIAWPLLFTKSKSHYLTVQYEDGSGVGQYAIIKLHKDNYRDALATVEAQTGKKVERNEES